jgi:DDE superfamily endonuclease
VFAVDPTVWARGDAECSPGRGFSYHPSRHSAGQPIVAGWCYQLVVGLELQPGSWTAPVGVRRLDPADHHNLVAAGQVRALLARLPAGQQVPLVAFDGGFDPVQLQVELAQAPVQVLVRVRSDRNFYAAGHPRRDGRPGRPARHGAKLSLADPATWPAPTATWQEADPPYGRVSVAAWGGLHPSSAPTATPTGTCGSWPAPWSACTWHGCPGAQDAVAVVGRPGGDRPGPGVAVARVRPPVRRRAHRPLLAAGPALDPAPAPHPGAGRPVHLGRGSGL